MADAAPAQQALKEEARAASEDSASTDSEMPDLVAVVNPSRDAGPDEADEAKPAAGERRPSNPNGGMAAILAKLEAECSGPGQEEMLARLRILARMGVSPMLALQTLGGMDLFRKADEEEPRPRMLETFDLEGVARYIAETGVHRIVVLCGAGISTSAGIPDFRTPGTGLYDNLQQYNLPSPESIFDIDYFREHPEAFYRLAREMWPGQYSPTPGHFFIRLLHDKGLLLRCYTQNIDSLEKEAGLPSEKLVAAHGNFDEAHVIDTEPERSVDVDVVKKAICTDGDEGWKALRDEYGGLVKPGIVFFGESLPDRFFAMHEEDLASCDLLIVMGTSLAVRPFRDLIGKAAPSAPRVLMNKERAGTCDELELGFRFHLSVDEGKNWRDVWYQGDCDTGAHSFAEHLGWRDDLEALIDSKGAATAGKAAWVQ